MGNYLEELKDQINEELIKQGRGIRLEKFLYSEDGGFHTLRFQFTGTTRLSVPLTFQLRYQNDAYVYQAQVHIFKRHGYYSIREYTDEGDVTAAIPLYSGYNNPLRLNSNYKMYAFWDDQGIRVIY